MNTSLERIPALLIAAALLSVAFAYPAANAGESGSGRKRPLIDCHWIDLDLVQSAGEGQAVVRLLTLEERLAELRREAPNPLPVIVWFRTFDDRRWREGVRVRKNFSAERNAIPLQKFRCYELIVADIPEGEVKRSCEARAPSLLFLDPAGRHIGEIGPRHYHSRARLNRMLERAWATCFEEDIDLFRRRVTRALDRRTLLQARQKLLKWWMIALHTGRKPGHEAELAEVEKQIEEIIRERKGQERLQEWLKALR